MEARETSSNDDVAGQASLSELLRLPAGPVDLAATPPGSTAGFDGGKAEGTRALAALRPDLDDLTRRLYAEGNRGGQRRVLVVLQGMDTSGKGGVVRKVAPLLDAQAWVLRTFGRPTSEEAGHHFLWRVERRLPQHGQVGFFDRSHYEDVLVPPVRGTLDDRQTQRRQQEINRWESTLVDGGTAVLKCFLHISADTQRERLLARLDDPTKHWKYDPRDLDDRARWPDYQARYAALLTACSPDHAPWYVVPADRKWYRNWAVATLLAEQLRRLDPQWPEAHFDVDEQRRLLAAEGHGS